MEDLSGSTLGWFSTLDLCFFLSRNLLCPSKTHLNFFSFLIISWPNAFWHFRSLENMLRWTAGGCVMTGAWCWQFCLFYCLKTVNMSKSNSYGHTLWIKKEKGSKKWKKKSNFKIVCIKMSLKTCFTVLFNAYDAPNTCLIIMVCDKTQLSPFSQEIYSKIWYAPLISCC